jgi:PEP-CTERM motif
MNRADLDTARSRTLSLARTIALTLVVAIIATPSSAALMGTYSMRLDAHVKSGGNTGVEGHFNPNVPYITPENPPHQLPATIDPPNPLDDARDLILDETEAAQHIVIFITNTTADAKLGDIFANPLDPAFDVEWEGIFSWTNVPAGEKIAITSIGFENGNISPFPPPSSQTVSGYGTVANPLHVLLGIDPSQFNPTFGNEIIGPLKIHLEYMTMRVPEPATAGLLLVGIIGAAGAIRRRRG